VYFHIFGFKWHADVTDAQKERATADIHAFRGKIPGLVEVHVGANQSAHGQGYTFAGVMRFSGKAACDAYMTHPQHLALLEWLKPLIDPVELDFLALD